MAGTSPHPEPPLIILIHNLPQARAALAAHPGALLITAPGAAASWGAGFTAALEAELGHPLVIDCGDDPSVVMAALRAGSRDLLFTGRADVARKLASMASQQGGRLRAALPSPPLALQPEDDPARIGAAPVPSPANPVRSGAMATPASGRRPEPCD